MPRARHARAVMPLPAAKSTTKSAFVASSRATQRSLDFTPCQHNRQPRSVSKTLLGGTGVEAPMILCLSARVMEGSCPHAMGTIDENVDDQVDVSHAFPVLRAALRSCAVICEFETGKLTHPTS